MVIFTTVHGGDMGDHGLMLILILQYQSKIRVPFIWSDPMVDTAGKADQIPASLMGIPSAIPARAGVRPFNGIQGRDLLSEAAPGAILVEEVSQRVMTGVDRPQRVRTFVRDKYRISLREGENCNALYDLEKDPEEMLNLYDSPASAGVRQKE